MAFIETDIMSARFQRMSINILTDVAILPDSCFVGGFNLMLCLHSEHFC